MKALTYFKAYVWTRDRMEDAMQMRGSGDGILVSKDGWALYYQRYARLARKLEDRLNRLLTGWHGSKHVA